MAIKIINIAYSKVTKIANFFFRLVAITFMVAVLLTEFMMVIMIMSKIKIMIIFIAIVFREIFIVWG